MSALSAIPPITHPLGKHWNQPSRDRIEVDDTHALMSEDTFDCLADYSCTIPSGVYNGKMWKRRKDYHDESKGWLLLWYADSRNPDLAAIESRELLVA